ncbi:MAG: polysaccharide deacetylase family protein [Acidobacteriota bacterium]|nr:polysaccharide deacetylase family protein [Acidobacteriota bacterium]
MWRPDLYITPEQFRGRLSRLREMEASVLPLDESLIRLEEGSLPPRSVTITFDDGFHDFLQAGLPALSDFGYPATLYLTTHYCYNPRPIISLILDYVLWKSGAPTLTIPQYGILTPISPGDPFVRQQAVTKIRTYMEERNMDTAAKDEAVQELAEQLGGDYGEIRNRKIVRVLDPEEVRVVAKGGVDIQLHTHRHRTVLDRSLFTKEIIDNRNRIVELTGKVPVHFCYPSGVYRREYFSWLRECNVKSATTCDKGMALSDSNVMQLPRVLDDSYMDSVRFAGAVAGVIV